MSPNSNMKEAGGVLIGLLASLRAGLVVTVTVSVAGDPVDDGVTELGAIPQLVPVGAPLQVRTTGSTKPFWPDTLIPTVPALPTATERDVVDKVALKSPMLNWAVVERVTTPVAKLTLKL